jgi:two-component system, sensor histidine kinase LadS
MLFRRTWMCAIVLATVAALFATGCGAASPQAPAELTAGTASISLTPHLSFLHDKDAIDSAEDAWRRIALGGFEPMPAGKTALGFQEGAYWFHAEVVNRDPDELHWMLVLRFAMLDRIDFYVRYPDGRIVQQASGDLLPFLARSISYRHPNFRIELPPGQTVEILVRAESQSSMQVPLDLYTPAAFTSLSRDEQLVTGVYYGVLLALFVYNLLLWLTLRDPCYFWYLFNISAFGLFMFTLNGSSFEYLWPNNPWLANVAVPLSICLANIGMQQFARSFLELPKRFPRGNVVSIALIGLCLALGLASLWLPYRISMPWATRGLLISVLWTVIAVIVVLRGSDGRAWLFLAACVVFITGGTTVAALAFGLLPKNMMTVSGVQIGSAMTMLMLSIALSYRYALLRNENERVAAEATMQLEDSHRRLRDSSRRDGLTGLYNRTHFNENFELLLKDSLDKRQPVSVLMIDLDHFKSINDRYGHLAGDDCLRWAAQRIGQSLRPHESALLARFGGEEFVVALPGYDLPQAIAAAEQLRQKLVEEPCRSGEHTIRVSASIGVHTVDPSIVPDNSDDASAMLAAADHALYNAKACGRDCVRTSIAAV